MDKSTAEFVVYTEKGVIQEIGKSVIMTPAIQYVGGTLNWYEDKKRITQKSELSFN